MRYPKYLKSVTFSIILSFITIFTLCMWFPHIAIDFVFVLDMVILYFLAIRFKWCAIVCKSYSDIAIKINQSINTFLIYVHALLQNTFQKRTKNFNVNFSKEIVYTELNLILWPNLLTSNKLLQKLVWHFRCNINKLHVHRLLI